MNLSRVLYLWAKNCDERKEQLQIWLDDAIVKCAQNGGQTIASSTANGLAVTFMNNSLTLVEWATALSTAIEIINHPKLGNNKAIQIFR